MAGTKPRCCVLDAGPAIHLDELGCLDLLEGFGSVLIPGVVWREILNHRPKFSLSNIRNGVVLEMTPPVDWPESLRELGLDAGELAALQLLEHRGGGLFLTDDAAARVAAEALGWPVHGTIGVIVRAIRRGTRSAQAVRDLLDSIPRRSTLHIDRRLLAEVIARLPAG